MHGGLALVPISAIQVVRIEELQARYPERRLLLFANASTCFDKFTGLPQAWLDRLASWDEKFLFTAETPNQWGRAEWALENLGFRVIPLSAAGLILFSEMLQGPGM